MLEQAAQSSQVKPESWTSDQFCLGARTSESSMEFLRVGRRYGRLEVDDCLVVSFEKMAKEI